MTAAMLNSEPAQWSRAASYAVVWPLIAACSIRRRTGSAGGFVVEYVVPQMLLPWIVSGKLVASWLPKERIGSQLDAQTRSAEELVAHWWPIANSALPSACRPDHRRKKRQHLLGVSVSCRGATQI